MNNRLTQLGKRLLLLTITFFLTMGDVYSRIPV